MTQGIQTGALGQAEGSDGEGNGRKVGEGGDVGALWLNRIDVWQKPTKFCKAIILQLKNYIYKKRIPLPMQDTWVPSLAGELRYHLWQTKTVS